MVLTVSGTGSRVVSLSELQAASDRAKFSSYATRSQPGGPTGSTSIPEGSTSVRAVLQDVLHISPDQVRSVTVQRVGNGGGAVTLTGDDGDLAAPGDPTFPYESGNPPAFFSYSNDQIGFIRPLLAGDASDTNSRDKFQDYALTGSVSTGGQTLRPRLVATPATTTPGQPVTLSIAGYTGGSPVGETHYTWDFDDGSLDGPDASSARHQWTSASTYRVAVTVQQQDGAAGGVATADVTVVGDKAPTTGQPGGGGGGAENGPTTGGPGGGKQTGGAPTKKGGTGTKGSSTREGRDGNSGATGTTPQQPSTTSSTAGEARRALSQARSRRHGKATPRRNTVPGDQVTGVLLDASAAAAVTTPTGSSAKVASATTRPATDIPRDWRWLLGGVPLVLLLLGVARQTPWLTRKLPELPWRTS